MEKDYSLLRPFDLEAAKRGEMVCWSEDGDIPKTFIATPEGNAVVSFDDSECFWRNYEVETYFRMAPLCWVEDRPVYKGDVLYDKEYGTRQEVRCIGAHDTLETVQPRSDGAFIICLEDATWTPPKVKRDGWMNCYKNGENAVYPTKEKADRSASYARVACIRIEWEE